MAQITINEISQSYSYNVGNSSYATVALPITASWGPGYFASNADENSLENVTWEHFESSQDGLESFVRTYRSPSSNYRLVQDFSYHMAMTLLTAGYDVLVCRVCPGAKAFGAFSHADETYSVLKSQPDDWVTDFTDYFTQVTEEYQILTKEPVDWKTSYTNYYTKSGNSYTKVTKGETAPAFATNKYYELVTLTEPRYVAVTGTKAPTFAANVYYRKVVNSCKLAASAKYPGTFGNQLQLVLKPVQNTKFHNLVVYVVDSARTRTAAENITFAFNPDDATDAVPYIGEVESKFVELSYSSMSSTLPEFDTDLISLSGGSDTDLDTNGKLLTKVSSVIRGENVDGNTIVSGWVAFDNPVDVHPISDSSRLRLTLTLNKVVGNGQYKGGQIRLRRKIDGVEYLASYNLPTEQTKEGSISLDIPLDDFTCDNAAVWESVEEIMAYAYADDDSALQRGDYQISVADARIVETPVSASQLLKDATALATKRYDSSECAYVTALTALSTTESDQVRAGSIKYLEWVYTAAVAVYGLLTDKLSYNPQRIISPGWDDQNISYITGQEYKDKLTELSPIHKKLMEVSYYSRCATGLLDVPRCLTRDNLFDASTTNPGYAQMLSRYVPGTDAFDINSPLFPTHSALCVTWGSYIYAGTSKQNTASPAFLALMIQRAMILNQAAQYEWALPTNRKHNLNIGKLEYNVTSKQLDMWQSSEGVGLNIIANIPGIGTTLWGNSTLYEVPAATYQALANLSTRYLVNAVKDVVYKCGVQITFQYNNEQAYSSFYAGVTPLLDTMKSVGAIEDYYVKMAADIDGLDHVNANTVIGKIVLVVNGVINDIDVDLIALPSGSDLTQYQL